MLNWLVENVTLFLEVFLYKQSTFKKSIDVVLKLSFGNVKDYLYLYIVTR